jgi:hypothetical protein
MKKLLAILLLLPSLVFADIITESQAPKKNFQTTKAFDGFMVNLEVPIDAKQLSVLKIKEFSYTLHLTKKFDLAAQATMKVNEIEGITDFKFINFGAAYKLKSNLIVGTSITSLSGSFDQTSKFLVSVKYIY